MRDFNKDTWDPNVQYNYPLDENSTVVDAGVYEGRFAANIYEKFKCKVIGLEPVRIFFDKCQERFKNNPKIILINAGLSGKSEIASIVVDADATSRFINGKMSQMASFMPLNVIMSQFGDHIDMIKINIEGSEFSVLENIINSGIINNIRFLQVQFHENLSEYTPERLENIRFKLSLTHKVMWRWHPMVWESWERKL